MSNNPLAPHKHICNPSARLINADNAGEVELWFHHDAWQHSLVEEECQHQAAHKQTPSNLDTPTASSHAASGSHTTLGFILHLGPHCPQMLIQAQATCSVPQRVSTLGRAKPSAPKKALKTQPVLQTPLEQVCASKFFSFY